MIASVRITHISWRDGRPRFEPGPRLRSLGYRGRNLQHPNGQWYSFEEAVAESNRISSEADARQSLKQSSSRLPRLKLPEMGRSLAELSEELFKLPQFKGREIREGKKIRKGLSPKTVDGYRKSAMAIEQACHRLTKGSQNLDNPWTIPLSIWTPVTANMLLDEIEKHSGLHQARACRAYLSQLWSRLGVKEPYVNKTLWTEADSLPVPEGRVRPWEPHEFFHMVSIADSMGRPEMGDSFVFGAITGQRQADRLTWTVQADTGGHIEARQSKRGRLVRVKKTPLLAARFAAAMERRKSHRVQWPQLIIDEREQKPFHPSGDHYRKVFRLIRDEATKTMPSCADLRDQDLRDANQTWLDRADVEEEAMAAIAGHAKSSAKKLQRDHYVAHNQQRADEAIQTLDAYLMRNKP